MDTLTRYRQVVRDLIHQYAHKPSNGEIEPEIIVNQVENDYELMHIGWDGARRVHGSVLHIDMSS